MLNYRLIFAPRWLQQVLSGLLFGVLFGLYQWVRDRGSVEEAVVAGVVGGLVFGVGFGWWLHRETALLRRRLGWTLPSRTARRAVLRGPLPDDPQERHTTGILIDHSLGELLRTRRVNVVCFGVMVLVGALLAFVEPWMGLTSLVGLFFLLQSTWMIRRLRERQARLVG